jgi:aerobic carbon-monoxide dehydrogenase large subunit
VTVIGARLPRKEDPRLLTGRGRFGDDVVAEGQLWARVVRSPVAHGRIAGIDLTQARAAPGVVSVATAADLPPGLRIPVRLAVKELDLSPFLQPVLAADVVRYVGEPVAVVVATDPYAAEDAAELADVDIEDLPAVTGADDVAAEFGLGYGDVDAAFLTAAHVVRTEISIGRHTGMPLEPRSLLAVPDPAAGSLSLYGMTKVPVFNRGVLAGMLGLAEEAIRAHAIDAGGGFGVRGEFYPEDFLIPWLALRQGRPVKWTEDRAEHLLAVNHSRQQRHRIAAAFDGSGRLLALTDDVLHDNGAYVRTHGVVVPELTLAMLPGPYRVPAYRGRVRVVLTSKTPCGTYRAPGRFEGTTAREQLLDVAADQIGLDRAEIRMRNLLGPDELPHARMYSALGTDVILDTGDYPGLLASALDEASRLGYGDLAASAGSRPDARRGTGVALYLEKSGLGPHETADVLVDRDGIVTVLSGGTSLGQGIETVLAQVAADTIGVSPDDVRVINGDTSLQPHGGGSFASRSTVVAGSAVYLAATDVRKQALSIAARMLEAAAADLDLRDGQISVLGDARAAVSLAHVARAAAQHDGGTRNGDHAGLAARRRFDVAHMTYPYGVHIAVVEVSRQTGQVTVLRYLVTCEVGRAVNPDLVEGQVRGGVAQGIGGALFEELRYDDAGQPLAASFMEYRMPTAAEVPAVDVLVAQDHPAPGNPLGVMGAGEGGISACGGAIACAVRDALGLAGSVGRLPLTPARVRGLAELAGTGRSSRR